MIPRVRVLQAPSVEPVSLTQAKLWCRVDTATEESLISALIQAARERAEDLTGRAFVRRQLELRLDAFPTDTDVIELPFPPLISVDYVAYIDADGTLQTLSGSPSNWREDLGSEPGRIQPLDGATWPATQTGIAAVRIGYTCGYAPIGSPEDETALQAGIPALVKTWMEARVSTIFDNRAQFVTGNAVRVPRDFVDGLLDGLRVTKLFA